MTSFINKFKIPTLLGLAIIFLGLGVGLYLVLREQTILSKAAPDITPFEITFTNITENSATISWQTKSQTTSFVTFGSDNPREQSVLDDRDLNSTPAGPKPRFIHYVTLKNLLPKTRYQFRIITGKLTSDTLHFETSQPTSIQNEFTPLIGSVIANDMPLEEGVAYLSFSEAITQSSLIKKGSFLIPLSQVGKDDLSGISPLAEDSVGKITIRSKSGEANILFKLKTLLAPLPPVRLGSDLDLTALNEEAPQASPTSQDLNKYDLNNDGKINAADNAIILLNFGPNPKEQNADLNGDKVVNQKDLDLMSQKIRGLISPPPI